MTSDASKFHRETSDASGILSFSISNDFAGVVAFFDTIEGSGYGGMASFEIARAEARLLLAENSRLRAENEQLGFKLSRMRHERDSAIAAERLRCAEAARDWFTLPPRFRTKENLLKSILKD